MRKAIVCLLVGLLFATWSWAQGNPGGEEIAMADGMRSNGKIYVVVGVLVIAFVAIVIYLIGIDRKVTRLEARSNAVK